MKPAARTRRNARVRLLRYLLRGGRLVRDGLLAYVHATRSGGAYPAEMVDRMLEKGLTHQGQPYRLTYDPAANVFWLVAAE